MAEWNYGFDGPRDGSIVQGLAINTSINFASSFYGLLIQPVRRPFADSLRIDGMSRATGIEPVAH